MSHFKIIPTYYEVREYCKKIVQICDGIQLRAGPYHKEGLYQTLLIHELNKLGYQTTRERVFNMTFKDSEGNDIFVGDNQSLRTDIELPTLSGILELKASNNFTKEENIWQLRNYLDQRKDMSWGIVINFISIFNNKKLVSPKVQCDIVYPVNQEIFDREVEAARVRVEKGESPEIATINTRCCGSEYNEGMIRGVQITRIWTETQYSHEGYPPDEDLVFDYDNAITYNGVPYPGQGEAKLAPTTVKNHDASIPIKIDTQISIPKKVKKKRKKKSKTGSGSDSSSSENDSH